MTVAELLERVRSAIAAQYALDAFRAGTLRLDDRGRLTVGAPPPTGS